MYIHIYIYIYSHQPPTSHNQQPQLQRLHLRQAFLHSFLHASFHLHDETPVGFTIWVRVSPQIEITPQLIRSLLAQLYGDILVSEMISTICHIHSFRGCDFQQLHGPLSIQKMKNQHLRGAWEVHDTLPPVLEPAYSQTSSASALAAEEWWQMVAHDTLPLPL